MKKITLWLLKKFLKSQKFRIQVLKLIDKELETMYYEDNKYTRLYLMVHELLYSVDIKDMDYKMVKSGIAAEVRDMRYKHKWNLDKCNPE